MKRSFTSFGLSALLHGVLLALLAPLLWPTTHTPLNQPATIKLTLSQFQAPVPPKEIATTPQPVAETTSTETPELSKPKANTASPKPTNPTPQAAIPRAFITKPKEPPKLREKPQVKPEPKPLPPKNIKPEAVKPPTATPELQQEHPVIKPTVEPSVANKTEQPNPVLAKPSIKSAVAQAERPVQSVAPATTRIPPRPVPLTRVTPPAPVAQAPNPAAETAYRRRMQALIDARKQYPPLAEKAEVEGSVIVAFTVLANGMITNANVVKSSGNQWLDNGAVQAVKAASGVLPFPTELRKTQLGLTIIVSYRLE